MADVRLLLVTGKGGVGKSAVAAAAALAAARAGLRVLAIEMTDAGGLSAHFSTGPFQFTPREVRPGLAAMRLERSAALLEYLSAQLGIPSLNAMGPIARAFDALATAAPGVREVITTGKVLWEVKQENWDLVVADAPPTGQIAGYLRAPRTVSELVPAGRIREQAAWMEELLGDGTATRLLVVSTLEELPVAETVETLEWLDRETSVSNRGIVANRTLQPLGSRARSTGPTAAAADLHRSLLDEQSLWRARLSPDIELPYLFGMLTPGEVAARLSEIWETT